MRALCSNTVQRNCAAMLCRESVQQYSAALLRGNAGVADRSSRIAVAALCVDNAGLFH
jgi:hypothetical protein